MLLQTFLQLNILILATPALAGWSLLSPVHAGTVHVVGIVWQYRGVETAAAKPVSQTQTRQAKRTVTPPLMLAQPVVFVTVPRTTLISLPAITHAARAP